MSRRGRDDTWTSSHLNKTSTYWELCLFALWRGLTSDCKIKNTLISVYCKQPVSSAERLEKGLLSLSSTVSFHTRNGENSLAFTNCTKLCHRPWSSFINIFCVVVVVLLSVVLQLCGVDVYKDLDKASSILGFGIQILCYIHGCWVFNLRLKDLTSNSFLFFPNYVGWILSYLAVSCLDAKLTHMLASAPCFTDKPGGLA